MGRRALISSSESEDEVEERKAENRSQQLKKNKVQVAEEEEEESENSESNDEDAKPIGDIIKSSGKGKGKRNHYKAFEFNGTQFEIEDPVLLTPEDKILKPYVAIIKDITQDKDGSMMVTGQWFYRPEEAEKRGGGSWEARDTRELFYSFHLDEVPAESVMHKCIVHFVPLNKKFPLRSQHPGFIVQRVYDTVERKLWKLTDKDYEDDRQHEIDLLVQKTLDRLGELPDIETEIVDPRDHLKTKQEFKRRMTVDIPREDVATTKPGHNVVDTPGKCTGEGSEYQTILVNFNAIIGDSTRDKSLEKLLAAVQRVCNSKDVMQVDNDKYGSQEKGCGAVRWPDVAVPAVVALEKAAHEALGSDHTKYSQKMRQLVFNLKNNARLATRMIKRELEASVILNMSPNELKDGLTTEETATNEPEESKRMPMTDARCSRCTEKKAVLMDIIQAGGRGDRYQLECTGCGNIWYASRDESSAMTINAPSVAGNVGTAPWATAKFEDVEKKLLSPRESEKPSPDIFAKKTTAYMPVLETQKSFRRNKPEDPPGSTTHNAEQKQGFWGKHSDSSGQWSTSPPWLESVVSQEGSGVVSAAVVVLN